MREYSLMDETVEKLCKSLREEPEMWVFKSVVFHHKNFPRVEYWHYPISITCIWNGFTTEQVFNYSQGNLIRAAVDFARTVQASEAQKGIMESLNRIQTIVEVVVEEKSKLSLWERVNRKLGL